MPDEISLGQTKVPGTEFKAENENLRQFKVILIGLLILQKKIMLFNHVNGNPMINLL